MGFNSLQQNGASPIVIQTKNFELLPGSIQQTGAFNSTSSQNGQHDLSLSSFITQQDQPLFGQKQMLVN
jgi:hypothetical protein